MVSLLPFPVLYGVSNFVYLILYKVIGYRKAVVLQNLHNAFPGKTEDEIKTICDSFYRYLCDLFLETFKTLTINKSQMLCHCKLNTAAQQLFDQLAAENKSFIIVMGHYGNWEWAGNTFSMEGRHQLYVIYHPLTNRYFNNLIYNMRTRFGTKLIAMRDTFKTMLSLKEELNATAFIADQTPSPDNAYWTTFLNQETPVFWGTELIAKKIGYPVVYVSMHRVKRGYYEIFAEMLVENPQTTTNGEISEKHTRRLEKDIMAQPEIWLWSHRRWKHKKPETV
jgi:KDO2-lipid IV(A) lauroyltransferase